MTVAAATWKLAGINLATRVDALAGDEPSVPTASLYTIRGGSLQCQSVGVDDALMATAQILQRQPAEAWALVADGTVDAEGRPVEALIVDVGDAGGTARIAFPYRIPTALLGVFGDTTPEIRAALLEGAGPAAGAVLATALGEDRRAKPTETPPLTSWTPTAVGRLPEEVRDALRRGYAVVLLAVAGADGNLDAKEVAAFTTWLAGALERDGPAAALLPGGPGPVMAHLERLLSAKETADSAIFATLDALNRHCRPRARRAYASQLRAVAKVIAEASDGGIFELWRKISPQEQHALDVLDTLLATLEI